MLMQVWLCYSNTSMPYSYLYDIFMSAMLTSIIFLFVRVQSHPNRWGDFEHLLIHSWCSMIDSRWGDFEHICGFKKTTRLDVSTFSEYPWYYCHKMLHESVNHRWKMHEVHDVILSENKTEEKKIQRAW